ncbi:PAQR family membrane homeostasis protein TrhA [Alloalcanivorax mobilis]|uniref:PAQR family membrane homeostasis protein TrhA n=1 Tax=Alloalcanivorax mobilis TaxID=2019569 RepID=UPI000B5B2612|nr:hemolysin III family protein [Alloalcanivorax mobilis]ASK35697.1 hemolysin III [Alcanivorax sp. N3-2A]|tara:strand:+ start:5412 stop:6071 length:660 start_codon:yes stop_codon:yes gene_type:complete
MASPSGATPVTYSLVEEFLNSLTHGIGMALSIAGTAVLVVAASALGDPWKIVSFSVFGACLTLLYTASMLYHGSRRPGLRAVYKVLDHCAIFALIAGTYTPFLLVNMRGAVGWTLFAVIWGLALTGIVLKLVFGNRYKLARVGIYLAMGWLVLFASGELLNSLNDIGFWLVLAGGLTYTAGVVFYLADRLPYNHAIWHLFVVGGSVCHFYAIYFGVLPA